MIIALYSNEKKLYFYFSLLSLHIGLYQLFTYEYYEATTLSEALKALKYQIYAVFGLIVSLYFFISQYTDAKLKKSFIIVLGTVVVFSALAHYMSPYSLRFLEVTSSASFELSWGEKITTHYGIPSPYSIPIRFTALIILFWGAWRAKVHYSKNKLESLLLGTFLFFTFISIIVGYLIDQHKIEFFYIAGFAYFFLVISMTVDLSLRSFKQQQELKVTTLQLRDEISLREEAQDELLFSSEHDTLTGLPNRRLLLKHMEQAIRNAETSLNKVAVLFIDLDHFKEINDSLGHVVGDKVLLKISNNMLEYIREGDTLARFGGDEFCILMSSIDGPDYANEIADKLIECLQASVNIDGHELYVGGSMGISIYPNDGNTPIELLRNADSAMYYAKKSRNMCQFYNQDMTQRALERIVLEKSMRRAIKNEEFVVYYQPQINGITGKLIGLEALVRWNDPVLGFVYPDKFIPLAEDIGLIIPLDKWVMRTAMKQLVKWYDAGLNPGILAMNISIKQLQKKDFISDLNNMCQELGVNSEWIQLEVTEGIIMDNPTSAINTLNQISESGIKLAIDDFGTGYSSLSYLKRLPIDKLKIDKSFVDGLPDDEEDESIAKAIIALAKSLNLDLIAEGVETMEQQKFLVEHGCKNIQGYLYAKPMLAEDIEKLFLDV